MGMRSGRIKGLRGSVFYLEEIDAGLFQASHEPPAIQHGCAIGIETKTVVGAYAIAELVGGQRVQIILTLADLEKRRARAMGGGKTGPWKEDFEAMARKSALRALFSSGLIPLSDEMVTGMVMGPEIDRVTAHVAEDDPLTLEVQDANQRTLRASEGA